MRAVTLRLWLLALMLASCAPAPITSPTLSAARNLAPTPILFPTVIPTATLAPPNPPPPPNLVAYYRLRIEYSTTSDWTTLEFGDTTNILSIRLMEIRGNSMNIQVRPNQLALYQPLEASEEGQNVGMVVDCALSPGALLKPLQFLLRKGDLGRSTLNVYFIIQGELQLLQEVTHQGVVENSAGLNPLAIQIDLSRFRDNAPLQADETRCPSRKMLWAFYYPWYSRSDWSSSELRDHPQTPYASDDPIAIARQIQEAQQAGIDGFISSWWGPGHYTDRNLEILLRLAQHDGLAVSIYFETLADGGPRDEEEILRWLAYAIDKYGPHPAFFKLDGKPVIVIWASSAVPLEAWQRIFSKLREMGKNAVFLGMGYNLANLTVFDGIHDYGIFAIPNLAGLYQDMARATHYYSLLASTPDETRIWVATVQPGYDDRLILVREGLFQDRSNGQFYRSTFEAALRSDPDWIFITTWNEWWEHTYIEPSELYGDLYLQITREFSSQWKGDK